MRPSSPDAQALRVELTAVVRAPGFLDTLPAGQREPLISEPLEPGLVVLYMVDLHGAAPRADHPVASALLSWTGTAWDVLKPPI